MSLVYTAKNQNGNILAPGTTVLLNLSLYHHYKISQHQITYYSMILCFQIQFITVTFILHARNIIMNLIKVRRNFTTMKRKYHDNPKPQKECKSWKYKGNPELRNEYQSRKKQVN